MIKETVGKRLMYLRKDLGNKIGEELSVADLAAKTGLASYTINRLENGLRGSTESLVILIRFYRMQGYNTDWILGDENQKIPMIVPPNRDAIASDLWQINDTLKRVKTFFETEQETFVGHLRKLGFQDLSQIVPSSDEVVLPGPDPV